MAGKRNLLAGFRGPTKEGSADRLPAGPSAAEEARMRQRIASQQGVGARTAARAPKPIAKPPTPQITGMRSRQGMLDEVMRK